MTPKTKVSSENLDKKCGVPIGSHNASSGVKTRYYGVEETAIDMSETAIKYLLKNFNLNKNSIDCLLSASATSHQAIPNNASHILDRLHTDSPIPAIDINTTCLSFLSAFHMACMYITSGVYETILIVSSERSHIALDDRDIKTHALFGDGAAAILISKYPLHERAIPFSMSGYSFETHPNTTLCEIRGGGSGLNIVVDPDHVAEHHYFKMDGSKLYKKTSKLFLNFLFALLKEANQLLEDIDLFIPHQASPAALKLMTKHLGIDSSKVLSIVEDFGNQVSASLPTALSVAFQNDLLKPNKKILLCGTAAGVSLGGIILELHV